jgi:hypothetical protein
MARLVPQTFAMLAVAATVACATHEPIPVFRSGVFVGERGISVPLPPPSLTAEPKQEVDLEGMVGGDEAPEDGTVLQIVDNRGDGTATLPVESLEFYAERVMVIDVTDSCLELWLVAPDGAQGEHALYSTRVIEHEDDAAPRPDEVEVVPGCSD